MVSPAPSVCPVTSQQLISLSSGLVWQATHRDCYLQPDLSNLSNLSSLSSVSLSGELHTRSRLAQHQAIFIQVLFFFWS